MMMQPINCIDYHFFNCCEDVLNIFNRPVDVYHLSRQGFKKQYVRNVNPSFLETLFKVIAWITVVIPFVAFVYAHHHRTQHVFIAEVDNPLPSCLTHSTSVESKLLAPTIPIESQVEELCDFLLKTITNDFFKKDHPPLINSLGVIKKFLKVFNKKYSLSLKVMPTYHAEIMNDPWQTFKIVDLSVKKINETSFFSNICMRS